MLRRIPRIGWWIGGIALGGGCLLWALALLWIGGQRGPRSSPQVLILLTQVPFETPTPSPYPTPTPFPSPTPSPTLPGGEGFRIGAYVQVAGTEGARLRFREAPGLDAPVRFLAMENEVFRIEEGPVQKDGYVWWYLVAPYSQTRAGWAVQRYLRPLDTTPESTPEQR